MVGIDCEQRCRDHTTEGTTCECNVTPQPTIAPPMVNGQCDMNCDQRCKDDTTEGTCCTKIRIILATDGHWPQS